MSRWSLANTAFGACVLVRLSGGGVGITGYRFDPWINFLMSDSPFGRFDRFVPFSPPLFL